jgi:hypothetical protein
MLVKHLQVSITKDKMSKVTATVPQWEAQVLTALWGDEAEIIGEVWKARPDGHYEPNAEFSRLADKYGPRDEEVPAVAKVYGSFGPGVRALAQEMQIALKVGPNEEANPMSSVGDKENVVGLMPIPEDGEEAPTAAVVKDDVPALAGNAFEVGGANAGELSYEDLVAAGAVDAPEPVDIDLELDDLTGEGEGGEEATVA